MKREEFWYDRQLWQVLSTLELTDYKISEGEYAPANVELTVQLDETHLPVLFDERAKYLEVVNGEEPAVEEVIDYIVEEIEFALQIEYNTVGHSSAEGGLYRPVSGNDSQWQKVEDEAVYDEYSDLLWEVTGKDATPDEHTIPSLYEPFLKAVAESDEYDLPHQGAVRPIIQQHLDQIRHNNSSRKAVSVLKQELERNGINPRMATQVAQNMDDFLIEDAELVERMKDGN